MNRKDFDALARDENGRDPRGRFRKPISERVLKFQVINGEKTIQDRRKNEN
jgi:hypothetical protein